MPKRSNDFQKLIYLVRLNLADGAKVEESKLLKDRLSKRYREVDVVIQGKTGSHPVIVSIECRDHKRAADVTWVDTMKAKHDRLPTNALLLASSQGFTKEATDIAEKYGVGLFTLENQEPDQVAGLLGTKGALWHKCFSLSPDKVRVHVAVTGTLEPETVVTSPDNLLYLEDGTELYELKQFVDSALNIDYLRNHIFKEGTEEHVRFELVWTNPTDEQERPLYMMKLEPQTLRRIEWVHIQGPCKIEIGEFGMQLGRIGSIKVAWGKTQIAGRNTLAVATLSEDGEHKLSINIKGIPKAE